MAYKRVKVLMVLGCGLSMRYGRAITAYQLGFETICTVSRSCLMVSLLPEATSLSNLKSLVLAPRKAFGDEDAAAEHGQKALFAIGHFVSAAHGFEGEEAKVVRHTETPAVAAALVGWHGEGLIEIHIAEQFVNVVLGEGFGEG